MKNTLFPIALFLCSTFSLFSQNNVSDKNTISNPSTSVDSTKSYLNNQPTDAEFGSNPINDEGTNDPTSTGAIKKIINGKEVYVKEEEVNGLKISITNEPN